MAVVEGGDLVRGSALHARVAVADARYGRAAGRIDDLVPRDGVGYRPEAEMACSGTACRSRWRVELRGLAMLEA